MNTDPSTHHSNESGTEAGFESGTEASGASGGTRPRPASWSAVREDLGRRLSDPTPAFAVLGASEVVARRLAQVSRQGAAAAARLRSEAGDDGSHLPRLAVGHVLTAAGKVEETYGAMAGRGRAVARRLSDSRQASELVRLAALAVVQARRAATAAAASAMPGGPRSTTSAVVVGETVAVATVTEPEGPVPPSVTDPVTDAVIDPVTDEMIDSSGGYVPDGDVAPPLDDLVTDPGTATGTAPGSGDGDLRP